MILPWGWGELKGTPGWRCTAWKEEEEGETKSTWAAEVRSNAGSQGELRLVPQGPHKSSEHYRNSQAKGSTMFL